MNDIVDLRKIVAVLLQKWWIIAVITILLGVGGYVFSVNQDPVYSAKTSLFVGRPLQSAQLDRYDIDTGLRLSLMYADVARRQPVLQRTVEALGLSIDWTVLRNQVRAQVNENVQLLDIVVEANSRAEAEEIADEIAKQLIAISPNGAYDQDKAAALYFAKGQLRSLQDKIQSGEERLEALELRLLDIDNDTDAEQLRSEIMGLEGIVARWEGSYAQILSFVNEEQPPNNLAVLEPALAGNAPVRPRILLNSMVAILAGLVLGIALVLILNGLDNTIKSPKDVLFYLSVPTLGAINTIAGKTLNDTLVFRSDPFSAAYEDYRLLRSKIRFRSENVNERSSLLITSPSRVDGKSVTAANLGIVMAEAGLKTILVDANLREPVLHQAFGLSNTGGLTHLLRSSQEDIVPHLCSTIVPRLSVLVAGSQPSNPSELLGSPRMEEVVVSLTSNSDIVIFDCTESVSIADASILAQRVDSVLLVVNAGKTDVTTARQALSNLHDAGANVIGVVLNRVTARKRIVVFPETSPRIDSTAAEPS